MTANSERGELSLKLDGADYVLRPSYEAIQAFEKQTGKGLLQLAMLAHRGELTTSEAAIVATECIRAWGREKDDTGAKHANPEKIGTLLMEAEGGVTEAVLLIGALLALAATGGCTSLGEVKAAPPKAKKASAAA